MYDIAKLVSRPLRGYERVVLAKMVALFPREQCVAVFGVDPSKIEDAYDSSWTSIQLEGMAVGIAENSRIAPAATVAAAAVVLLDALDSKEDDGFGALEAIKRFAEVQRDYGAGKEYFYAFGDGSPGGAARIYGAMAIAEPLYVAIGLATSATTTAPDVILDFLGLRESDEDAKAQGSAAASLLGELIPAIV